MPVYIDVVINHFTKTPSRSQGCATVTPLPAATGLSRVAYKYLFALTPRQWARFSASLRIPATIKTGHIACFSTMNFQVLIGTYIASL